MSSRTLTFTVPGLSLSSSRHRTVPSCRDVWRKASGSEMLFFGDSRTPKDMSQVTVCSAEFMSEAVPELSRNRTRTTSRTSNPLWCVRDKSGGWMTHRRIDVQQSRHKSLDVCRILGFNIFFLIVQDSTSLCARLAVCLSSYRLARTAFSFILHNKSFRMERCQLKI